MRLYHGTTLTAIESMEKDQILIPNKLNSSDAIASGYDPTVYFGFLFLTNSISNAIHYSTMAIANNHKSSYHHPDWGNLTIVLEIELPEQQLLPDLHDASLAKTWEESLERCMSVRYEGNIPLSSITRILFCHYEYDMPVLSCSFEEWRKALAEHGNLFNRESEEIIGEWLDEGKLPLSFQGDKKQS